MTRSLVKLSKQRARYIARSPSFYEQIGTLTIEVLPSRTEFMASLISISATLESRLERTQMHNTVGFCGVLPERISNSQRHIINLKTQNFRELPQILMFPDPRTIDRSIFGDVHCLFEWPTRPGSAFGRVSRML